jgi:hypothetical protein
MENKLEEKRREINALETELAEKENQIQNLDFSFMK